MTEKPIRPIAALFLLVALYDGLLGAAFLVAPSTVFQLAAVAPPNHVAYVQFPAALLIIFALMFVAIARKPVANRHMIIYGVLLKLSYCGLAFWYWFSTDIPGLWKPFAVIDLVTAVLFGWVYGMLRGAAAHESTAAGQ
jgi:hypothetical protein